MIMSENYYTESESEEERKVREKKEKAWHNIEGELSKITKALKRNPVKLDIPDIPFNSTYRSGYSASIEADVEAVHKTLGLILERVFPTNDYPNIQFHIQTREDDRFLPQEFDDSNFFIDDRADYKKGTIYKEIKKQYGETRAEELCKTPPDFIGRWLRMDEENHTRLFIGPVGTGKTAFLKHSMLDYIKGSDYREKKILFLYIDCNQSSIESESESENSKSDSKTWKTWFVTRIFEDVVKDFITAKELSYRFYAKDIKWLEFLSMIIKNKDFEDPNPSKRLFSRFPEEIQNLIEKSVSEKKVRFKDKSQIVNALNNVISQADFYQKDSFTQMKSDVDFPDRIAKMISRISTDNSPGFIRRLNRTLFNIVFSPFLEVSNNETGLETFFAYMKRCNYTNTIEYSFSKLINENPEVALKYIIWYLKRNHPESGKPVIIIDNSDPGETDAQVAAFRLLTSVCEMEGIKGLVATRFPNWFSIQRKVLPMLGSIITKTFGLAPPALDLICSNRLRSITRNYYRLEELKDRLKRAPLNIDYFRAREYFGKNGKTKLEYRVTGFFQSTLNQIIETLLTPETQTFLRSLSNGNIRTTMIILSNFFKWKITEADVFFTEILKPSRHIKIEKHLFLRRILTEGEGYMSDSNGLAPHLPINLFLRRGCSNPCSGSIRLIILREIIESEGLVYERLPLISTICPKSSDTKSKKDFITRVSTKCIIEILDFFLAKGLLYSTAGLNEALKTLEVGHKLILSPMGELYYTLSANVQYLAAVRYKAEIFHRWSKSWPNPMTRTPFHWQLAANAEFVCQNIYKEKEFISQVMEYNLTAESLEAAKRVFQPQTIMTRIAREVINHYETDTFIQGFIHRKLKKEQTAFSQLLQEMKKVLEELQEHLKHFYLK